MTIKLTAICTMYKITKRNVQI